jgi:hypothetical protein
MSIKNKPSKAARVIFLDKIKLPVRLNIQPKEINIITEYNTAINNIR